jgi:hypothetical protein
VNLCRYQELKTAAGNEPVDLLQDPELDKEDFVKDLEDLYELIPCPQEFDYAHYTHGTKVNYVEPCILNKDLEGPSNSSLELSDGTKKRGQHFFKIQINTKNSFLLLPDLRSWITKAKPATFSSTCVRQ